MKMLQGEVNIAKNDSPVQILRIPTNEELVIAMDTEKIVNEYKKV